MNSTFYFKYALIPPLLLDLSSMVEESKISGDTGGASPGKDGGKPKIGQVKPFIPRVAKLEGKTPNLKGHIYDCTNARQSDQFMKTTKEVAEHVGRTYKYGGDIRLAVMALKLPSFDLPPDLSNEATRGEIRIFKKTINEHHKRTTHLKENVKSLYAIVWGQCSNIMRTKVEAMDGFSVIEGAGDGIALLKSLKSVALSFPELKWISHSLHEAMKRYYNVSQGKFATTQAYLDHFQNLVDVVIHSGGEIARHPGVENQVIGEKIMMQETMNDNDWKAVNAEVTASSTAMVFLLGSNCSRFGRLIEDLENAYLQGHDNYPMTVSAAYNLLEISSCFYKSTD